jgi:hypothetical protein
MRRKPLWIALAGFSIIPVLLLMMLILLPNGPQIAPLLTHNHPLGHTVLRSRERLCNALYARRPTTYSFSAFSCQRLVPPSAHDILPIYGIEQIGPPVRTQPQRINSLWRVGALLAHDRSDYASLYVWSARRDCALGLFMPEAVYEPRLYPGHSQQWRCPRALQASGPLTITGATGVRGVVSFSTARGQRGTFDLATDEWQMGER